MLGDVYRDRKKFNEAEGEYHDHDGSLHYQIYMLYKKIGDESAAREALEQSEALRKNWEKRAEETLRAVE